MRIECIPLYLTAMLPALAAASGIAGNTLATEEGGTAWATVERLQVGQAVRVLCPGQRSWTGRLAAVTAEAVVVNVGGIERKTPRSEVLQVQVKSRARSALIGLGIGAGAGVGIGYAAGSGGGLKSGESATAAALGAGLFGAAGAGVGSLFPGWKTVYRESPSEPQNAPARK